MLPDGLPHDLIRAVGLLEQNGYTVIPPPPPIEPLCGKDGRPRDEICRVVCADFCPFERAIQ